MNLEKKCSRCQVVRSFSEYYLSDRHKDGYYSICVVCCRKKAKNLYDLNKEHYKKVQADFRLRNPGSRKNSLLKSQNGITLDQYEKMLKSQNGVCSICKSAETNIYSSKNRKIRSLTVDHSHSTGKVRGLLCSKCNLALGLVKDNPAICDEMSVYLRNNL